MLWICGKTGQRFFHKGHMPCKKKWPPCAKADSPVGKKDRRNIHKISFLLPVGNGVKEFEIHSLPVHIPEKIRSAAAATIEAMCGLNHNF
jgi:hypothetical protein